MNNSPLISVCIPTWNRWYTLQYTLQSIIDTDEFKSGFVEIVISDNASTDETEVEIKGLCKKYKNIRYFKNAENIGAMANINRVMELGIGKYLWCLGSDDVMLSGCLKNNIFCINKYSPVMTINLNGTNPCNCRFLRNRYYDKSNNLYVFPDQKSYFDYIGEQYKFSKQSYILLCSQITWISSTCILKDYYIAQKDKVQYEKGLEFYNSYNFIHSLIYHYSESNEPIIVLGDFFVKANREIANKNMTLDIKSCEVGQKRSMGIKYIREIILLDNYFIDKYKLNNNFSLYKRKDIMFWIFGLLCAIPILWRLRYYMPSRLKGKILDLLGF